jgi:dihydroorotate dehydrogenase
MRFQLLVLEAFIALKMPIEKIKAGADLIQLYTGFIYEGPALIKRTLIKNLIKQNIL